MYIEKLSAIKTNKICNLTGEVTNDVPQTTKAPKYSNTLNGLNALASYNSGEVKNLLRYGNIKISPIESEEEFENELNSLKNTADDKFIFGNCFSDKNSPDKYSKALQAYIGEHDISMYINRYMSSGKPLQNMKIKDFKTGKTYILSEKSLKKYIRIMEYSLRKTDEKFSPYKGTVYRSGYFDKNGGQFWSTSKYAKGAVGHASGGEEFPVTFSVIKVYNGYDIHKINKNTRFSTEEEVLLRPNGTYTDITDKISKNEYASYYNDILNQIKEILKENFGTDDIEKAKEFIGSLKVYIQE